jgi:hypothetical protein
VSGIQPLAGRSTESSEWAASPGRLKMVAKLCKLARVLCKVKTQRDATRVWNLIDNSEQWHEEMWGLMCVMVPWAFDDVRDPNTIRFVY